MATIPVNEPWITQQEIDSVTQQLAGGWISSESPVVAEFEQAFAKACDRAHGIAVSNGTLAIDLSIAALNLSPGDQVIVPAFTIISCVNQILREGAVPIFIDSDPLTWNLDVRQLEGAISDKTKGIVAPHIYGLPVDMDPLLLVARKYNLWVLEDAAEAHGLRYYGRPCGSFGTVSTFSFYANKNITSGEGGMVLTDDGEIAERLRSLRNLAFQKHRRFVHEELGWNARMTGIQAALALPQLGRLEEIVARRREVGRIYREELRNIPGVELAPEGIEASANDYWVVGAVLSFYPTAANELAVLLANRGVGTRPFFFPLHLQPAILSRGLGGSLGDFPTAEKLGMNGIYFPNGLGTPLESIRETARNVRISISEIAEKSSP